MFRILFIDDDKTAHNLLRMVLPAEFTVISSLRGDRGVQLAEQRNPDVVLLDVGLPDVDGIEVLRRISSAPSPPPVVMLTSYADTELVVQAVKAGALDYLVKPFTTKLLIETLKHAIGLGLPLTQTSADEPALRTIIGESEALAKAKMLTRKYASSDSPVLIHGESGAGKELFAQAVHALSRRREEPFITKNCGAIPIPLVESEMFGAEKGAYTDAISRPGSFEQANNGTIFLDEVGELPKESQVKLLRVIEEGKVTRIGALRSVLTDVRIISATNRDLSKAIEMNEFRADLYYRLNVLPIRIPPLRERMQDIPLLVGHFLHESGSHAQITSGAWEKLHSHTWPGNVRELKSVVERALLLSDGDQIGQESILF